MNDSAIKLAVPLVKLFEGCRLTAYQDTAGIWTIGVGHTGGVTAGLTITQENADQLLIADLAKADHRVDTVVTVPLKDCERACLISQAFNLRSFGQLAHNINADAEIYRDKILLYCYDVAGHKLKGLLRHRICERLLFEEREWASVAHELESATIEQMDARAKELFV